ncbi:band 3 anion transport protein-like isoform X2 [Paramacrobiotus metropolitanus]|nr:band 3 anion transport protein-like isoform X2 [Paramacrobiotus metropolitanus]XP_055342149.1 band 3 anion transport protein-like isoform X2 [Paramacrobiotus metropolitanus]
MERRPLQGRSTAGNGFAEDEASSSAGGGTLAPLDPELNDVLEKLLTPKNTSESLVLPSSDQPDTDVGEDSDRFDDEDFDEHRGFSGATLHTHHPLVPQYLKKKLGRRKSIPPSASHPARLQERTFTPEFRALLDAPASFPHILQPVSEQTEPTDGDDQQEPLLSALADAGPPVYGGEHDHEPEQEPAFQPTKPSRAKFYFSAESLAHESPPGSPKGSVTEHRRGSAGSHRLQKSVSIQEHSSPEHQSTGTLLPRAPSEPNGEVRFLIGTMSDDDELWQAKERRRSRKQMRAARSTPLFEDPSSRRRVGSDVESVLKSMPTETEEAVNLKDKDLDGMWGHRMQAGKVGVRPRMKGVKSIIHPGKGHPAAAVLRRAGTVHAGGPIPQKRRYERTPHEVYVEMEELVQDGEQMEWKEKARWIKYEEDVEMGDKWGKPHAASLSFHSLLELRKCLEKGTVLLDLEGSDIGTITMAVVDNMVITDQIKHADRWPVTRALLVRHRHMSEQPPTKMKGSGSAMNFQNLIASLSFSRTRTGNSVQRMNSAASLKDIEAGQVQLPANATDVTVSTENTGKPLPNSASFDAHPRKFSQIPQIRKRIPHGAEATTVLVGALDFLREPAVAFVRLAYAANLHGFLEVDVPIRFLFVLLCPKGSLDYYEIGRSLSTLMSNKDFHDAAYRADDRRDLLNAMNEFLADSIVLPPGHLDKPSLLPLSDIQKMNKNVQQRRRMSRKDVSPLASPKKYPAKKRRYSVIPDDTLRRTGRLFGGLINDVKRRFPWYWSDIRDGLNFQCLASIFFIFFANLAPAITFGGILEDKVKHYMGVSEMLIASSLCGMMFSLVSAQPLTIIGATGPLLVFEYSLYKFCKSSHIEFMPFRIWIGFWVAALAAIVTAFDLGVLIRHVTRFTEEVFAVLIAFIFTFESLQRIYYVFYAHPLLTIDEYCTEREKTLAIRALNGSQIQNLSLLNPAHRRTYEILPSFDHPNISRSFATHFDETVTEYSNEPNTALFCVILIIGTLFIATELRQFRNSKYLGRNARRAIGDFGVPIAICAMVLVDILVPIHTAKLDIPSDLTPTAPNKRGWFINPFGIKKAIAGWEVVAAIIPALLVFILMYVEVQITCILVNKKERKLKKGSGYHLDLLIVSFMALACSFFGLPWMCAATVQTISHISSLSVYSRTHAPGEKPKLLEVREQRVTNFFCSFLIGCGVVFGSPALRLIPKAVVFGVFLYLGLSSITGVQFVDRIKLFFRPAKHHYDLNYVRKVRTWKMHAFTGIQLACLAVLIAVKSTDAALGFPFVLLLMVPLRRGLSRFYTKEELHELDKDDCDVDQSDSERDDGDDEKSSLEETHMPV